jgi:hypothetical protein
MVHAVKILSHRDQARIVRSEAVRKRLRLYGDAIWIKTPVRLDYRADMESLFEAYFDERLDGYHESMSTYTLVVSVSL